MDNRLIDFIDTISAAKNHDGVRNQISYFLGNFGFDNFSYLCIPKQYDFEFTPTLLTNMDDDWINYYNEKEFAASDWTIEWCLSMLTPAELDMDNLPDFVLQDQKKRRVMKEAQAILTRGRALPFRTERMIGGIGFYGNMSKAQMDSIFYDYESLIHVSLGYAHFKLVDQRFSSLEQTIHLTEKEHDVLRFKSEGLTSKMIARKMHVAEVTVNFHWRNIAEKLRVETVREIVPKALAFGLI